MKSRFIPLIASVLCLFAATHAALAVSTFVVINTSDAGAGSLRQAILDANATPNSGGPDLINFAVPGGGVKTISPTSAFPAITDPVVIDGTTQGVSATPLIELNGAGAGSTDGLQITAGGSTVKGLAINRFFGSGISLSANGGNTIQGNFIGTDPGGTVDLGNTGDGVSIVGAPSNTIGGTTAAARNIISGNNLDGVEIFNTASTGNLVQGNYIGTDVNGTADLGNNGTGVKINLAQNNTIGGTIAAARNVISGNGETGMVIIQGGATGNQVQGNFIGTNVNGTAALGNSHSGVFIGGAQSNTIGGTIAGAGNVISGNVETGVALESGASANQVQGNFIGTDVTGTADLGNGDNGVFIEGASNNTIGGTGGGNVISGNGLDGVAISGSGSSGTQVQGNYIGTDVNGTSDLGNSNSGVFIGDAPNNTIGGTTAAARNIISGNNLSGLSILGPGATGNQVQGNFIGTAFNGTTDLGNSDNGITLITTSGNTIGGTAPGAGNFISGNDDDGVFVISGTGNRILSNSIHSNSHVGIDLGADGVAPNDPGDGDTGPNNLQNFPVLTSANTSGGNITIQGSLNSAANTAFRIEFFSSLACDATGNGEGQTFLGATNVTTVGNDATINAVLPGFVTPGHVVTATATDPANNTSEFSACVTATGTGPSPTPSPTAGPPSKLINISTRMRVETGSNVLIGGFIITGTAPKNVAIRGIGPSLAQFGIPDLLADPTLELHSGKALLQQNDNWQDDPAQAAELTALGLPLQNSNESGMVASLPPAAYTAIVAGKNNGTGVGLVEIYDTGQDSQGSGDSQLANISTRGFVLTGSNVMIGGFILGGGGNSNIAARGIGPSLAVFGLSPVLPDPTLSLHDGNGALLIANDNWQDDPTSAAQLTALGLAPPNSTESGIYTSLPPGAFTAIVAGSNGSTGIGLVEIYNISQGGGGGGGF